MIFKSGLELPDEIKGVAKYTTDTGVPVRVASYHTLAAGEYELTRVLVEVSSSEVLSQMPRIMREIPVTALVNTGLREALVAHYPEIPEKVAMKDWKEQRLIVAAQLYSYFRSMEMSSTPEMAEALGISQSGCYAVIRKVKDMGLTDAVV